MIATAPLPSTRWLWPAAFLLMLQILTFVWLAPRGFEFTDEAFYLLNGMYWRDFTAVYTQFGVYLDLPMRLSGGNVVALRIMTMLTLLGSGAFLGNAIYRHAGTGSARRLPAACYWLAGAAGGMYFFGPLSTVRAPSYNTIALCALALATAFLLRSMDAATTRARLANAFAYGFVMGICGLCKGSTGFLAGCLHLSYFCIANTQWRAAPVAQRVGGVAAGLMLQLLLMTAVNPHWIAQLQAGTSMFSYDSGGKLGGMFNDFRWDIQRMMKWSPVGLLLLAIWSAVLVVLRRRLNGFRAGPMIVAATALVAALWMWPDQVWWWWPAAALLLTAALLAELFARRRPFSGPADRKELKLWFLLLCLPFAFSFGTNMQVLWHSQVAAMFIVLLIVVRMERLWQCGQLSTPMAATALSLLCLPPLVFQERTLANASYTYRLPTSMLAQNKPQHTAIGNVLVDGDTSAALTALRTAAQRIGLDAGSPILDFTGDGPGLVVALAGRPVGIPWVVGGYPDSHIWAERLLRTLPASTLQSAWILSSPDNPRAIPGWQRIASRYAGVGSHELAAVIKIRAPSAWGKAPKPDATLCIWRPRSVKTTVDPSISCNAMP